MAPVTENSSRMTHLLALMKKGDDAFNVRDFATTKALHHPEMIAHVMGSTEPIRGEPAHAAAMNEMIRIFPDVQVHSDPYPVQWNRRLDHRSHTYYRNL